MKNLFEELPGLNLRAQYCFRDSYELKLDINKVYAFAKSTLISRLVNEILDRNPKFFKVEPDSRSDLVSINLDVIVITKEELRKELIDAYNKGYASTNTTKPFYNFKGD